jgi:hypothetical protein
MEKIFTVAISGDSEIIYEDSSCIAKIVAADFRDKSWYIGMGEVIDKKTQNKCGLSLSQKRVLFQRVSFEVHKRLFTDDLGFIICEDKNTVCDNFIELLEVSE